MADYSSPHAPGTFCWVELSTTDQAGGIAFYRALFGWEVTDQPIGPTEVYSMFQMRGTEVAAAYTMRPEERQSGAPPHWNMYVAVEDADAAVAQAQGLGAMVFAAPFDVMEAGRMAVLQDPTGAVFQIWQAKGDIGAKILYETGALCWSELTTRDTHAAESFYTELFDWTAKHSAPSGGVDYTELSIKGEPAAGMMAMPANMPAHIPAYWMPYFQVDHCDASTTTAQELGATLLVGPNDIPQMGRFSIFRDPQGAVFAVFQFGGA